MGIFLMKIGAIAVYAFVAGFTDQMTYRIRKDIDFATLAGVFWPITLLVYLGLLLFKSPWIAGEKLADFMRDTYINRIRDKD